MKKFFPERAIVVILFITALVVFSFASADAHKVEARLMQAANGGIKAPETSVAAEGPGHAVTAARD